MSSEEKVPEESITEHKIKYIQKENDVTASNSEKEPGTPVYTDETFQLLDKRNYLENAQESAASSGSDTQINNSNSVISQTVFVLLEEEKYINQFGEDRQAKLTFIKNQGLNIAVPGKPESTTKVQKEVFSWLQEHGSTKSSNPKIQRCIAASKHWGKQPWEQKSTTSIQSLCTASYPDRIKFVDTEKGKKKYSQKVLYMSDEQEKHTAEFLDMEKLFHPTVAGSHNRNVHKTMQEEEAHLSSPSCSKYHTDRVFTRRKQQLQSSMAPAKVTFEDTKKKTPTDKEIKLQHKYAIGPMSKSAQEILETTGISREISPSDSMSDSEILQDEPECSKKTFSEVSSKAKSYIVSSVSAPSWIHRYIIGKKGQNISKIVQNMPQIYLQFTGNDEITIRGPAEDVNYIREHIEVAVKDLLDKMIYEEINIDCKVHKYLIGKDGAIIKEIKKKNNVSVIIPPRNENNNLIRIEGETQGVQQTKKELLELAAQVECEQSKELIIEQRYHYKIIGNKGEKIRDIRKKFPKVMINFPDPAQKSDIVQLRGPKYELEQCTQYLEEIVADLVEHNHSITIPIFKTLQKNILGKEGANIKKICAETLTRIRLPSANGDSANIVISGKRENCEEAYRRILSMQKTIDNISEAEISVPPSLHEALRDPKVCLTDSIMSECGEVCIQFPRNTSGFQNVIIRGPSQSVEKAKNKLLQLAEEIETKNHTVKLLVKPQYHKFFMSKSGGNIPKICQETGAHIIFPVSENKEQELLTITGTEKAVKNAQRTLENIIKSLDNIVEDNILVNSKHYRYFIIRKGHVLQEMTEDYGGVTVNFSYSGEQYNKITIKGAEPCVQTAKKKIQEMLDDLRSQVTKTCVIPYKYHGFVIGPRCCRVRQITRDYNVEIKFPKRKEDPLPNVEESALLEDGEEIGKGITKEADSSSPRTCDIIYITGRKEKCESAIQALMALIPVTAEVDVPFNLYRYIIGQKGSEVNKIIDEFDVNIQGSSADSNSVSITGLPKNVEKAKARLLERVMTLQATLEDRALRNFKLSFTVDPKYHSKLIGHKGIAISQFCSEHDVAIHFPNKESKEAKDQVTITGYESNTIAARDAILKMVRKFEKYISKVIPVNHRVHGQIIGYNGKALKKIMNKFEVDIRLPRREAPDPNLVIVEGFPNNVKKAIDHILDLEQHYLAAIVKHDSEQQHIKGVSLCDAACPEFKSFARRNDPSSSSTNQQVPDMNSPEDFPGLGQQVSSKTIPPRKQQQ